MPPRRTCRAWAVGDCMAGKKAGRFLVSTRQLNPIAAATIGLLGPERSQQHCRQHQLQRRFQAELWPSHRALVLSIWPASHLRPHRLQGLTPFIQILSRCPIPETLFPCNLVPIRPLTVRKPRIERENLSQHRLDIRREWVPAVIKHVGNGMITRLSIGHLVGPRRRNGNCRLSKGY
jgi:hypothetical protein